MSNVPLSDLILLSLAAWRILSLLAHEAGPGDVLLALRSRLGVIYDDIGRHGTTAAARLIICVWCSSVWAGLVFAVLYIVSRHLALALALPFAISALAIAIEETLNHFMPE